MKPGSEPPSPFSIWREMDSKLSLVHSCQYHHPHHWRENSNPGGLAGLEKGPGLWSSLPNLSAHTPTIHVYAGTKDFACAQSSWGTCHVEPWHWLRLLVAAWHTVSLWALLLPWGRLSGQWSPSPQLHSLPPLFSCLRFTALSPVPASSVRSSFSKSPGKAFQQLPFSARWVDGGNCERPP